MREGDDPEDRPAWAYPLGGVLIAYFFLQAILRMIAEGRRSYMREWRCDTGGSGNDEGGKHATNESPRTHKAVTRANKNMSTQPSVGIAVGALPGPHSQKRSQDAGLTTPCTDGRAPLRRRSTIIPPRCNFLKRPRRPNKTRQSIAILAALLLLLCRRPDTR